MEVVVSLSQGRTAAAQCGLFTHRSVPVIFEPPCTIQIEEPRNRGLFTGKDKKFTSFSNIPRQL